jgi:Nucleotidyl transferase AbiEii toxin, Type IV TA system
MHEKALPTGSRATLEALSRTQPPALAGWTLAGGTGLALHLGHRRSEDFDFFRTTEMDVDGLFDALGGIGPVETLQRTEGTLTVLVRATKLSFFQVRDPFLFPPVRHRFFGVADVRDIALMKLAAITNRGSRKDFIDLYFILTEGPALEEHLGRMADKYGAGRINLYQVVMSLAYFDDAEAEPMPRMLVPFDWEQCKGFLLRECRAVVLP